MRIIYRGMAITLAALILAGGALAAPVETVLFSFNYSDGGYPVAGLIADKQSALYGTTAGGGGNGGTVFKLTPPAKGQMAWKETVLYSFKGASDGAGPQAGLIADNQGALYGTTQQGGGLNQGAVFKLTPPAKGQMAWTEAVLYSFEGANYSDGAGPEAGPIADNQGALYGTTQQGGSSNGGTVFKLTPPTKSQIGWKETVLYSFCSLSNCSDGGFPLAGLIADKEGALYGTTYQGGSGGGNGTVFKLTAPPKGQTAWKETVLYRFCSLSNCSDGKNPQASLIADHQGALYGTTKNGGSSNGGTVFKLTPPTKSQIGWKETVLYSFCSLSINCSDGGSPLAGLIADNQGALYGTTYIGGSGGNADRGVYPAGAGTVFKLSPPAKGQMAWKETVLYNLCSLSNCSDGSLAAAGLIADKEGALYSTTYLGGNNCPQVSRYGCGTVFKLAF